MPGRGYRTEVLWKIRRNAHRTIAFGHRPPCFGGALVTKRRPWIPF
ncbi:hypothetical protein SCATT_50580 [Streptantibioticus cattleyicolor NRRL 8057 = DSM 46488]|uniref:Uncharacterized protein n=1 Tax=Streptantibioticus cattleyicolor (strain ATCC 35852 / DSM 46488 / JCM 4925 / NBRC 14057 / NRRL 8057) TaxID=1003195 RepID=G8X3Q6_STREN|nr:hypothetical protein SCATT_50580 [Streptantibioticus cattleyicolor NRRL 8057 = DSM 46488]